MAERLPPFSGERVAVEHASEAVISGAELVGVHLLGSDIDVEQRAPLPRMVRHTEDYFRHPFTAPGDMLRIVSVCVSSQAASALLARLEQIAREYSEQHNANAWLPLDQRRPLSLCLAVRNWEPTPFRALRRDTESAPAKGAPDWGDHLYYPSRCQSSAAFALLHEALRYP